MLSIFALNSVCTNISCNTGNFLSIQYSWNLGHITYKVSLLFKIPLHMCGAYQPTYICELDEKYFRATCACNTNYSFNRHKSQKIIAYHNLQFNYSWQAVPSYKIVFILFHCTVASIASFCVWRRGVRWWAYCI